MDMNEINTSLQENLCNIEDIYWMGGYVAMEKMPLMLIEDFFDMEDYAVIEDVLGITIPEDIRENQFDCRAWDEVYDWLYCNQKITGFILKVSTPVPTFVKNGAAIYVWGSRWIKWIYADDFLAAVQKGIEWSRQAWEKEKNKK